jgi:hypothetical protein
MRGGVFNYHSEHVWALVNLCAVHKSHSWHKSVVNIWTEIMSNMLFSPHVLPEHEMQCRERFTVLLEAMLLEARLLTIQRQT